MENLGQKYTNCIEYPKKPNKDGYIRRLIGSRTDGSRRLIMSHRYTWEKENGTVPKGYEIHHKCRNRRCCNILHLELIEISLHKTLTNRERYRDIIEKGHVLINEGYSNKYIADTLNRSIHTVSKWRGQKK